MRVLYLIRLFLDITIYEDEFELDKMSICKGEFGLRKDGFGLRKGRGRQK